MSQPQITAHFAKAGPRPPLPSKNHDGSKLKRKPPPQEVINLVSSDDDEDDDDEVVEVVEMPLRKKGKQNEEAARQFLSPHPLISTILSLYPSISPTSDLFKLIDFGFSKITDQDELALVIASEVELRKRVERFKDLFKWSKLEEQLIKKAEVEGGVGAGGGGSSKQVETGGEGSRIKKSSNTPGLALASSSKPAPQPQPRPFIPRAGKERAVDSDSDDEVRLVERPAPPVSPLRRFQRRLSTPPPPPPLPAPNSNSNSASIPRISPSASPSHPPQPSHSPNDPPPATQPTQPRRTGRLRNLKHQSLAYSKSGIKLPTSRRTGRPDDDGGDAEIRCGWCCKVVGKECKERLCKDGEETAPDARGCGRCKGIYLAERKAGRSHHLAVAGLLEIVKPSRVAHEARRGR